MIPGAATIKGTQAHARNYKMLQFNPLGRTQWQVSQAGFGGYRVSVGIDAHYQAMVRSLSMGINLIDTSTNYTDGGSEQLIGRVLKHMVSGKRIDRESVVIVSKVGYLQGQNFALSQERKQQGKPFPELVPYSNGLEHCIHPEFIGEQLSLSLERLGLETLDLFLLHNPEYYLGWAIKQGLSVDEARDVFYQRIRLAFEYLEEEVARGRLQAYGISANTFPASVGNEDFVSLEKVWHLAEDVSKNNHFQVVQFPMNVFETGAVLEENQRDGHTVLKYANQKQLGVLINRPLNAFVQNRLIRLAEAENIEHHTDDAIIQAIGLLNKSEKTLWHKLLPALNLPMPLYRRIKDQVAVGDQLKHHWRNFGSYERWRQFKDGLLWPHVLGVFDFLKSYADQTVSLDQWLASHRRKLDAAVQAVGSLYVADAKRNITAIKRRIKASDSDDWAVDGSLSQLALRALRSTTGISVVLVGMRCDAYVDDVLKELSRNVDIKDRVDSWRRLQNALDQFS